MVKKTPRLKRIPILIIVGPTASGKSKLAIEIARAINGCIINADSRQIYKHCHLGTNSPSSKELNEVPHYLYNFLEPSFQFSAAEYSFLASEIIINLHKQNIPAIVVGGAGLYIKAILEGLFKAPGQDKEFRDSLKNIANLMGTYFLFQQLQYIDSPSSKSILPNDQFRIIRALEIFYLTGRTKSELIKCQKRNNVFYPMKIGILPDKNLLLGNIEKRTNEMIENGLISEAKFLINNYPISAPALNAIGYKEIILFLQGKISKSEAISLINKNTKLYAKRQLTWFKKDTSINWLSPNEINLPNLINKIKKFFDRY